MTALVGGARAAAPVPAVDAAGELIVAVPDPALLRRVADRLDAAGIPVAELGLRLPSLDDVFLTLTGRRRHRRPRGGRMTMHRTDPDPRRTRRGTRLAGSRPCCGTRPRWRGAGIVKTIHSTRRCSTSPCSR